MSASLLIPIHDRGQAGEARRKARVFAREAGASEEQIARVELVVTELANNLELHTKGGGELVLRKVAQGNRMGVEILALDKGPGSSNFSRFMHDGYSTAGTPGTGLGAVERTSQVFEVHAQPDAGTARLSQVWSAPAAGADEKGGWQAGSVNLAMRHELVSGDTWSYISGEGGRARMIIADGLGHGPAAAEASRRAVEAFSGHREEALPALMATMHEAARGTRGAAVAVAEIDPAKEALRYVGVGNIAGCILTPEKSTSMVSMNGTVGVRSERIQEFTYGWPRDGVLVMSSDGIKTQWNAQRYPGLLGRHAGLIAGVLYRDYNRGTDDTTVAVMRTAR